MTDLFKALSSSFARFVYAWLIPSVVTTTVFTLLVLPDLHQATGMRPPSLDGLGAAAVFALAVLTLSVIFAYTALPIYRLLEGYTLPRKVARRLHKRRVKEWYRLRYLRNLQSARGGHLGELEERLKAYPERPEALLPTRLGNALRAMERYGSSRFGLDSQTMWYELQAVSPESLRQDLQDARSSVDFFVSSIAHLSLLAVVSGTVGAIASSWPALLVALFSLLLVPAAYRSAVQNVGEWRAAVQALVNIGRVNLAPALGLQTPATFREERRMWLHWTAFVSRGDRGSYLRVLDAFRSKHPPREFSTASSLSSTDSNRTDATTAAD